MFEIKKNKITLTRGDTLIMLVKIYDKDKNPYIPVTGDRLRFAAKKDYNDAEPMILKQIPIDTCLLRIESSDTKAFEQPGTYYYDVELTYGDNIVATIISSTLTIKPEVY